MPSQPLQKTSDSRHPPPSGHLPADNMEVDDNETESDAEAEPRARPLQPILPEEPPLEEMVTYLPFPNSAAHGLKQFISRGTSY
jgi:hypothetical protein